MGRIRPQRRLDWLMSGYWRSNRRATTAHALDPAGVAYARGGLDVILKLGDFERQEFRARAVSTELAKHFGGFRLHDRLRHVRLRVRPCAARPPGGSKDSAHD